MYIDWFIDCNDFLSGFSEEHGGHGEEPRGFPAGGATRAEEGDGHPAEEDPHGHGEFSCFGFFDNSGVVF